MAEPLKGNTVEEVERALEAALLGVSGRTVKVTIRELVFDEFANRVDVKFSAWDKLSTDPFAGSI